MSKDIIYRQDAINVTWEKPTYSDPLNILTEVRDKLKNLPSAEPEAIKLHVGRALTKKEIKNLKQKIADSPMVFMPCTQLEPRWIPCNERLPQEDTDVLVTVYFMGLEQRHKNGWNEHIKPNYYVEVARQIDGEWSSDSDEYKIAKSRHKVIAWMSLPAPYRGEDE